MTIQLNFHFASNKCHKENNANDGHIQSSFVIPTAIKFSLFYICAMFFFLFYFDHKMHSCSGTSGLACAVQQLKNIFRNSIIRLG